MRKEQFENLVKSHADAKNKEFALPKSFDSIDLTKEQKAAIKKICREDVKGQAKWYIADPKKVMDIINPTKTKAKTKAKTKGDSNVETSNSNNSSNEKE